MRAAFDAQIRRNTRAGEPGAVVEADGGVLRWLAPGTQTSRITWSELTSDSADAVIAAQVRYSAARGTPVERKLYDYDQPADLAQRLLAAGFAADDEELMLVAETAAVGSDVKLPDGVRLDLVTSPAGVEAMMAVHGLAFAGHPSPGLGERLATQLREAPELVQMVVAMAGDEPVSAARVEFIPGTDFAGLWGGGTVPAWRGRLNGRGAPSPNHRRRTASGSDAEPRRSNRGAGARQAGGRWLRPESAHRAGCSGRTQRSSRSEG